VSDFTFAARLFWVLRQRCRPY